MELYDFTHAHDEVICGKQAIRKPFLLTRSSKVKREIKGFSRGDDLAVTHSGHFFNV